MTRAFPHHTSADTAFKLEVQGISGKVIRVCVVCVRLLERRYPPLDRSERTNWTAK